MRSPHSHGQDHASSDRVKKGPWSTEEDEKLIAYIKRYGIWNWTHMPKPAGLARTGKSCRLRWLNYLRPNIRHGKFTREEEETIIKWQGQLGNRWSAIAKELPGRTDNDVKNYWNTRLKRRILGNDNQTGKTMVDATTSEGLDSNSVERNSKLENNTSVITTSMSTDNVYLKASPRKTMEAPTSSAGSHCPSSSSHFDLTLKNGEEHASSLRGDDESQSFWEKMISVEDLYGLSEINYIKSQELFSSLELYESTYASDSFEDFGYALWDSTFL